MQAEEDRRLYGSRHEPPDVFGMDENANLTGIPPKCGLAELEAQFDRSAKIRKQGKSQDCNHHAIAALDWNNGASPLDAWLNQSALPSTNLSSQHFTAEIVKKDPVALEEDEIKVFRNVHIGISQGSSAPEVAPVTESLSSMELDTQIFYRNIMDRYPLLSSHLAHRLARANHDRATRLRLRRHRREPVKEDGRDETRHWSKGGKDAVEPFHVRSYTQQSLGHDNGETGDSKGFMRTPVAKARSVRNTENVTKRFHSYEVTTRAASNKLSCSFE